MGDAEAHSGGGGRGGEGGVEEGGGRGGGRGKEKINHLFSL